MNAFAFMNGTALQWAPQRKTCTKCGESKPRDQFYERRNRPYGDDRESCCKRCRVSQVMQWKAGR